MARSWSPVILQHSRCTWLAWKVSTLLPNEGVLAQSPWPRPQAHLVVNLQWQAPTVNRKWSPTLARSTQTSRICVSKNLNFFWIFCFCAQRQFWITKKAIHNLNLKPLPRKAWANQAVRQASIKKKRKFMSSTPPPAKEQTQWRPSVTRTPKTKTLSFRISINSPLITDKSLHILHRLPTPNNRTKWCSWATMANMSTQSMQTRHKKLKSHKLTQTKRMAPQFCRNGPPIPNWPHTKAKSAWKNTNSNSKCSLMLNRSQHRPKTTPKPYNSTSMPTVDNNSWLRRKKEHILRGLRVRTTSQSQGKVFQSVATSKIHQTSQVKALRISSRIQDTVREAEAMMTRWSCKVSTTRRITTVASTLLHRITRWSKLGRWCMDLPPQRVAAKATKTTMVEANQSHVDALNNNSPVSLNFQKKPIVFIFKSRKSNSYVIQ